MYSLTSFELFLRSPLRALLGLSVLGGFSVAHGQTAEPSAARSTARSGSITGRVQNAGTGKYLVNVQIVVKGTNLITFTDDTGSYRVDGVPSGPAEIDVVFTGLDRQTVKVDVVGGQSVQRDVLLTRTDRYGTDDSPLKIDPYLVSVSKTKEGSELAVNEQRFAANLKNVVATDAFGGVNEGNIAEFMKFMPSISIEYEGDAPTAVSVRGFNSTMTEVSFDGAQQANAVRTGGTREFHFKQVSINDISRIEVTKVPTPATAASTMAGSVNLVSKSAFEREKNQLNYNFFLAGNSRSVDFHRMPWREKMVSPVTPNFSLDYTHLFNKDLGFVISALTSLQLTASTYDTMGHSVAAAGTAASPGNPYLSSYQRVVFPAYHNRYSLSGKIDWRPTRNSLISFAVRTTYYQDINGNMSQLFSTGTNGTPSVASGVAMSFNENQTIGATGRGNVSTGSGWLDIMGVTVAESLRYRWQSADWKIDGGFNHSNSRTARRTFGTFGGLTVSMADLTPVRVSLENLNTMHPGSIRVFNNNNQEIDYHDLKNYRLTAATYGGATYPGDVREAIDSGEINVRRNLMVFEIPFAVQIGGVQQVQNRKVSLNNINYTYNSPDGDLSAARFQSPVHFQKQNHPTIEYMPVSSPQVAYKAWQANPSLFSKTPAQQVAEELYNRQNTYDIREKAEGYYVQGETRILNNRLRVLGGVRYEKTTDTGNGVLQDPGAAFMRNADGTFVRNAANAQIRLPAAGAVGSMEELNLTTVRRGTKSNRSYDGLYPSAHFTYSITEALQARAAFAQTYGRPDFDSVIPNTVISQSNLVNPAPGVSLGLITVRNTGLKPWSADNYDLSLEYYPTVGGVMSMGVFDKEISDFYGNSDVLATEETLAALDLGPEYVGYTIRTKFNSGDARVQGIEANFRQSLRRLGFWGRNFEVFANATKLKLRGNQNANFSAFLPFSVNAGVTFRKKPFTLTLNGHYNGEQPRLPSAAMGPGGYQYIDDRRTLDMEINYQASPHITLYLTGTNIFNQITKFMIYNSETPDWAKVNRNENFGVKFNVGVKGTY